MKSAITISIIALAASLLTGCDAAMYSTGGGWDSGYISDTSVTTVSHPHWHHHYHRGGGYWPGPSLPNVHVNTHGGSNHGGHFGPPGGGGSHGGHAGPPGGGGSHGGHAGPPGGGDSHGGHADPPGGSLPNVTVSS